MRDKANRYCNSFGERAKRLRGLEEEGDGRKK